MNAKLCKKLRRVAKRATVGAPARRYVPITAHVRQKDGTFANVVIAFGNDPKSTRGVYRELKRQVARQA